MLLSLNSSYTCQIMDTCSPLATSAPGPHTQYRLRHSFLSDAERNVSLPPLLNGIVSIIWKITFYLTDIERLDLCSTDHWHIKCSLEPLFPLARYFNLISYLNCVIFFCIRYYTIKETHTYSLYS